MLGVLTALGVGDASAATKPFSAALSRSVSRAVCGTQTICLSGTDQGRATHLGRSTLTKTASVHLTSTPCDGSGVLTTYTEEGTLRGANGDELELSGGGTACVVGGHAVASGELAIIGGTGRFEPAVASRRASTTTL